MMTWSFLGLDFLKTRSLTDFMISYDLVRTFESLYVRGVHFDNVPSCLTHSILKMPGGTYLGYFRHLYRMPICCSFMKST